MAVTPLVGAGTGGVDTDGLINESVMQRIFDLSKIPLPLTDMIGSESHDRAKHEWTMRRLAAPVTTNKVVDGSDLADTHEKTGVRVANHTQISVKGVKVSQRVQQSDTVGIANELAKQVMERGNELRRDVEAAMLSNNASVADDGSATAGQSAGLLAWANDTDIDGTAAAIFNTAADRGGAGGDAGGWNSGTEIVDQADIAATAVALTEESIRDVAEAGYQLGADYTTLMAQPSVIRKLSEYMFTSSARIATLQSDVREKDAAAVATGSVNVFVTDFGVTLRMIPNRLQQDASDGVNTASVAYLIDPEFLCLSFLSGYRTDPLAKNGLADTRMINAEWTLVVKNWEGLGAISDIDDTAAVTAS